MLLAAAGLVAVTVAACGGNAATTSSARAMSSAPPHSAAPVTPATANPSQRPPRGCQPEYSPFQYHDPGQRIRTILRRHGFNPNHELAYAGRVTVVTGLARETADGHAQSVFFFAGGRLVATDLSGPDHADVHFTADICRASATEVVTVYLVNVMPSGHAPGCPPTGAARVRWRIDGTRVTRLDPLPTQPCG